MSTKAGQLLWNRMHLTIPADDTLNVDTGLTQLNRAFGNSSDGEPTLGVEAAVPPAAGALPASRIQVIPLVPTGAWATVTHGEPYFDTDTGTVHVLFANSHEENDAEVNVLFWNPHTSIGPGDADTYTTPIIT
jgi:hypothetical protein